MPKVEKVGHDLFSPLHYTCPTPKVQFPYLSWLHQKHPWSFFLCFFVFFLLCSYWLHLYLFFDFLKERRLKKLTPSFIPTVQHQKKEKTLSSSLPLILGFSHQEREIFSCKSDSIPIFPSRTINLVRVLATLILESMISLKNF